MSCRSFVADDCVTVVLLSSAVGLYRPFGSIPRLVCASVKTVILRPSQTWRHMQVPEHVSKGYDKAQAAVALRTANEAAVAPGKDADSELLAAYMAYTKLEEAQGDPARVQVPLFDAHAPR